jgi:hypothetical protein
MNSFHNLDLLFCQLVKLVDLGGLSGANFIQMHGNIAVKNALLNWEDTELNTYEISRIK